MAIEAIPQDSNRPYASPSNVTAVLLRLRSRNMPERIDNEYLRDAGVPEGSVHRTMFALRFLGLVNEGVPSSELRALASSTDEEYRNILARTIRSAYREVFDVVDPAEDQQNRIVNFFRRYTPASQRERMVVFFLGMCREAGIATLESTRQRSSSVSVGSKRSTAARTVAGKPAASKSNGGEVTTSSGIAPALELLVRSLPPEGTPMTEARRQQWLTMAEAAMAFVYPDEGSPESEQVDDEEA